MSNYSEYVNGLVKLIESGRPVPLKEVIYARLKGEKKPVHGLVSPSLGRDEPDENAVFYFLYEKFESAKNGEASMLMRRVVLELLMDAFTGREKLLIIDALGQMAGYFQVKEYTALAGQLWQQLWGFMYTKLGSPPAYVPMTRMMQLGREEMEYAWRALDLWLTVTPPLPADRDAHYYKLIKTLYENALQSLLPTELHFHLFLLIFRTLIKIKPHYTGRKAFLDVCKKVEELDSDGPSNIYRHGWLGFCRELGVLFKYDRDVGAKWKDEFKTGILAIDEYIDRNPLFWDSLKRMDGLDIEIRKNFKTQPDLSIINQWPESFKEVRQ